MHQPNEADDLIDPSGEGQGEQNRDIKSYSLTAATTGVIQKSKKDNSIACCKWSATMIGLPTHLYFIDLQTNTRRCDKIKKTHNANMQHTDDVDNRLPRSRKSARKEA